VADFLVRLMDDRYIVVEIEKSVDPIMSAKGDLSWQATHAIRQALEYRDWLISNYLYARQSFEKLWRPRCMVVIGLESSLTLEQTDRLRQENESRQGMVEIIGFDQLLKRAEAMLNNIIYGTGHR
jgi:hypothetical protein